MVSKKNAEKQLGNTLLQLRKIDKKVFYLKIILIIVTFLMLILFLNQ